jgi:hypothetical protein
LASNFKIGTAARNAACDAIVDLIDAGAGAGTLTIRTGAPPTNVSDADSGTLLATLTFSDPAFGASASGTATASAITSDTNADASGDAGHFRVKDSNGNTIFQGTAGEAADTPDLTFDEKSIVAGGTVACSSFTVSVPIQ